MDEVKDKSGRELDTQSWKQEAVDDLPLQKNGYVILITSMDQAICGLFYMLI